VAGAVIEVARPDGKAKWRMQAEKSMACELEPRAAPRTISYLHNRWWLKSQEWWT
jgi:hypothetical protein